MQICVVKDGELLDGAGETAPVPWWSFTKLLIAAAFWRNDIDIEQPYRDRGGRRGGPFTFYTYKELLMHRAGLNCYGPLPHYHEAVARGDEPWDAERFWAEAKADKPLGEPGSGFHYSNIGYMLLREALEDLGLGLDFATGPIDGYDPRWVAHGLKVGTVAEAAQELDRLAHDGFGDWALADQTRMEPMPERPWTLPTYGLGVMADIGRCFGHTGQGPVPNGGSTFACYHFRREGLTIAAYEESQSASRVEHAIWDLAKIS